MSNDPAAITGNIVIVAHIDAAPGKGDEVEKLIKAVRDSSVSDVEPGTLVYRVSRFNESFAHFEEYENADAIAKHTSQPGFLALVQAQKDGIISKLDYALYKEF